MWSQHRRGVALSQRREGSRVRVQPVRVEQEWHLGGACDLPRKFEGLGLAAQPGPEDQRVAPPHALQHRLERAEIERTVRVW